MELEELRTKYEAMKISYHEIHGKIVNDWTELRQVAENRFTIIRMQEQQLGTITESNEKYVENVQQMESEVKA